MCLEKLYIIGIMGGILIYMLNNKANLTYMLNNKANLTYNFKIYAYRQIYPQKKKKA